MRAILATLVVLSAAPSEARARGFSREMAACLQTVTPLLAALRADWSDMARRERLSAWARGRPIGACQVAFIIPTFMFSGPMLEALAILAPQIVDRQCATMLLAYFPMQEDRAEAGRLLGLTPPR